MRFSFREVERGRTVKTLEIGVPGEDTRTHKVVAALKEACLALDLPEPIWLDSGIREFKRLARVRFTRDCFVEELAFDYLEMKVIEEDEQWTS